MADKIATRTFAVALFCAVLAGSSSLVYTGKWIGKVNQSLVGFQGSVFKLDASFNKMDAKLDARFDKVDDRLDKMDAKSDARFNKVDDRVSELKSDVSALKTSVVSVDTRLSNLERHTWPHHSASELGKLLPGATKSLSATDTSPTQD